MKPVKVFFHLPNIPYIDFVATEQITTMGISGLLDSADTVYFSINDKESNYSNIKALLKHRNNVEFVCISDEPKDFEHSTIVLYQQVANSSDKDFYSLYLHPKGVTHIGTNRQVPMCLWRQAMMYFAVERWLDSVKQLEQGADTCGIIFSTDTMPHYSGNIRWATSDYIKRIPQLVLPSSIDYQLQLVDISDFKYRLDFGYRFEAEFHLGAWANRLKTQFASLFQLRPGLLVELGNELYLYRDVYSNDSYEETIRDRSNR